MQLERALALTLALFCLASVTQASAVEKKLWLTVEVGRNSQVTNAGFDAMANGATSIAVAKNNPSDVACPNLRIVRSGDVFQETTLPRLIDTQAQMNIIAGLDADVFVVDQLSICGSIHSSAVAGCERSVGPIVLEGGADSHMTLLHEIGHGVGLSHTTAQCPGVNPSDLTRNNVMYCKRHSARIWLAQPDCNRYMATTRFAGPQADLDDGIDVAEENVPVLPLPTLSPTQQLLLDLFSSDGLDFTAVNALTDEQVDAIRGELIADDPAFWEKAAYVLAIRGTPQDALLISQLEQRARANRSSDAFRAETAVPEALGMYFKQHPSEELPDWAKSQFIEGVNVPIAESQTPAEVEDRALVAKSYALGAALTGDVILTSAVLDVIAKQQAQNGPSALVLDTELVNAVAERGVASRFNNLQVTVEQSYAPVTQPLLQIDALRKTRNIDVATVRILRDLNLEGGEIISQFDKQNDLKLDLSSKILTVNPNVFTKTQIDTYKLKLDQLDLHVETLEQQGQ